MSRHPAPHLPPIVEVPPGRRARRAADQPLLARPIVGRQAHRQLLSGAARRHHHAPFVLRRHLAGLHPRRLPQRLRLPPPVRLLRLRALPRHVGLHRRLRRRALQRRRRRSPEAHLPAGDPTQAPPPPALGTRLHLRHAQRHLLALRLFTLPERQATSEASQPRRRPRPQPPRALEATRLTSCSSCLLSFSCCVLRPLCGGREEYMLSLLVSLFLLPPATNRPPVMLGSPRYCSLTSSRVDRPPASARRPLCASALLFAAHGLSMMRKSFSSCD
mmetsp:Transcript_7715/g.23814  ORF Transcript_7715/g.23814 Transcript_7715/m.23814 type:complete len:274 (-) Transcript_7715:109-930(-)